MKNQYLIFTFCFFIALFLWGTKKLSKNYIANFSYTIQTDQSFQEKYKLISPNPISLQFRGSGYQIIKRYWKKNDLWITENVLKKVANSQYEAQFSEVLQNKKNNVKLSRASNQKILFKEHYYKYLKIQLNNKLTYAKGVESISAKLSLDSLQVFGEKNNLEKIDRIIAKPIVLSDIKTDQNVKVELEPIEGVYFKENQVFYKIQTGRIIEEILEINIPKIKGIVPTPQNVKVTYGVPMLKKGVVKPSDFKLKITLIKDYVYRIELAEFPKELKNVVLHDTKIYLIKE